MTRAPKIKDIYKGIKLPIEELRVFWAGAEVQILHDGFCAFCRLLDMKPQHFVAHIRSATDIDWMVPDSRTLSRFFKGPQNLTESLHRSGLLLGCKRVHAMRNVPDDAAIKKLIELSNDHESRFQFSFAEAPTHSTTEIDNGDEVEHAYTRRELQLIYDGITYPTADVPDNPEFPPTSPHYPATPTNEYRIKGRAVLIKDESYNFTGTHKDRWAWEMMVRYKKIIGDAFEQDALARPERPKKDEDQIFIPRPSIISSGSAALAVQYQLRLRGLPNLSVVIHSRTPDDVTKILHTFGAKVYPFDLDSIELSDQKVLEITKNPRGIDFTTRHLDEPHRRNFYDWLACELLVRRPRHIFVPVGTGELFANIICIINDAATGKLKDRRLEDVEKSIMGVNVYGATTYSSSSKMDKLYAPYRPILNEVQSLVADFKKAKTLGPHSGIFPVSEKSVSEAMQIAKTKKIRTEYSGIAGLAHYLDIADRIPKTQTVAIVNTGWMYLPPTAGQ